MESKEGGLQVVDVDSTEYDDCDESTEDFEAEDDKEETEQQESADGEPTLTLTPVVSTAPNMIEVMPTPLPAEPEQKVVIQQPETIGSELFLSPFSFSYDNVASVD